MKRLFAITGFMLVLWGLAVPVLAQDAMTSRPAQAVIKVPSNRSATSGEARARARPATPLAVAGLTVRSNEVVRTAVLLTVLAVLPALVICMTPFIRIVVVLSMVRHAFGMPETPPNPVLISLALLITFLVMGGTLDVARRQALDPFLAGSLSLETAMTRGAEPMRQFMMRQVKETDVAAVYQIARQPVPPSASQVGLIQLTSAFMLNELRTAFKIGFVIFLPFLVIDVVVSSLLVALGMIMVPPSTLSLPLKILMFVLIDGWGLVLGNVAASFR